MCVRLISITEKTFKLSKHLSGSRENIDREIKRENTGRECLCEKGFRGFCFFAFFPLGFLGCFWPKRWCYATAITNESTERARERETEEAEVGRGKRRSKTIEQIFNKAQNCSIFLLFAYLICFEVFFTRCVRVSSPVCLCQPASLSVCVCVWKNCWHNSRAATK